MDFSQCGSAHRRTEYEYRYRGIFKSPFDYETTVMMGDIAKLHASQGKELTDSEKEALSRLGELERRGGIINPISLKEFGGLGKVLEILGV